MASILVQVAPQDAAAALVAGGHTTVTVTDAGGNKQSADLNGAELDHTGAPLPFSHQFDNVAEGAGTAEAQSFDATGAPIGTVSNASFTVPAAGGGGGPPPPSTGALAQPGVISVSLVQ